MATLIFSGSGLLYPAHLGAAEYIIQHVVNQSECKFVGTSGGSLVSAILANHISPLKAKELAKKILPKDIISFNWSFWQPARSIGLFSLNKLEKTLEDYVPKTMEFSKMPLKIVTANVDTKQEVVFSKETTPKAILPKVVCASCAVPFIFTPVEIDKQLYVDGGIVNGFALDLAYPPFDKIVIGIKVTSEIPIKRTTVVAKSRIESRIDYCAALLGTMLAEGEKEHVEHVLAGIRIINIKLPYEPFDFFGIGEKEVDNMFEIGYKAAEEAFIPKIL